MSVNEFNLLQRYEKIFGKRIHYSDFLNVFKIDESEWLYIASTICARCGKLLWPWERISDMNICKDCDENIKERIPWKSSKFNNVITVTDDREILQLR